MNIRSQLPGTNLALSNDSHADNVALENGRRHQLWKQVKIMRLQTCKHDKIVAKSRR
jgi:hypothetical protein